MKTAGRECLFERTSAGQDGAGEHLYRCAVCGQTAASAFPAAQVHMPCLADREEWEASRRERLAADVLAELPECSLSAAAIVDLISRCERCAKFATSPRWCCGRWTCAEGRHKWRECLARGATCWEAR